MSVTSQDIASFIADNRSTRDAADRFFSVIDQVIDYHSHDRRVFNEMCGSVPLLEQTITRGLSSSSGVLTARTSAAFTFDVFNSFYKRKPSKTGYGSTLACKIIDAMHASDQFKELHASTILEPIASSLACSSFARRIMREMPYDIRDKAKREQEARTKFEEASTLLDEAIKSGADEGDVKQYEQDAHHAEREHKKVLGELENASSTATIKAAVSAAIKETRESVEEVMQAGRLAGTIAGNHSPITPDACVSLAETVERTGIKKLLELVGRVVIDAQARRLAKSSHDAGVTVDVTLGGDPSLMLEGELVGLLGDKAARLDVLRRIAEETALQLEVESPLPAAKGPVVVLVDCSGSMTETGDTAMGRYSFIDQAKALALATVHAAARRHRAACVVFFDSRAMSPIEYDPRKPSSIYDTVASVASQSADGGTNFDAAINAGLDQVATSKYAKADIVFITDGQAYLSSSTVARFKAEQARIGLGMISFFVGSIKSDTSGIAAMSDRSLFTNDLLTDNAQAVYDSIK